MGVFCLIPARGGSKRIKNKNIKIFHGKPLISYAISQAKKSSLFDKIFVSTDSPRIAKIAEKCGATIPFLRPKNISNDRTTDDSVRNHFFKYFKDKIKIDYLCYLYPCTPLLKANSLKKSFQLISQKKYGQLTAISKYSSSIQRALEKNSKDEIAYKDPKFKRLRSQNLKEYYYDAGQFYWYNLNKNVKKRIIGYEISAIEAIDINTLDDFNMASTIYKKYQ